MNALAKGRIKFYELFNLAEKDNRHRFDAIKAELKLLTWFTGGGLALILWLSGAALLGKP